MMNQTLDLQVLKIYLADSKGRIYREIKRNSNGKFQFDLLDIDKSAIGDFFC
ncbi:MAG: hypothetical protein IPH32_15575 [Bacteroidetes bacterium]|nr:hypothetical protein [Bacteroidota bacterium]